MNKLNLSVGAVLRCKYPKHGTRNILKRHEGVVEKVGVGPRGPYATVRHADGTARTLSEARMIDASVVS
jgi:hypothetical protein